MIDLMKKIKMINLVDALKIRQDIYWWKQTEITISNDIWYKVAEFYLEANNCERRIGHSFISAMMKNAPKQTGPDYSFLF